jgi:hypothetical protein
MGKSTAFGAARSRALTREEFHEVKRISVLTLLCALAITLGGCAVSHGVSPSAWYQSYEQSRS